jgi:hypothetical protein
MVTVVLTFGDGTSGAQVFIKIIADWLYILHYDTVMDTDWLEMLAPKITFINSYNLYSLTYVLNHFTRM